MAMGLEVEWFVMGLIVVLMSSTDCEKDSLLGQTIPSPEPSHFLNAYSFIHPLHTANIIH